MPSIFEFLHPDDHADVIDSVLRMTRGEIDHLVKERRLVLRDGSRLWCRLSSSVLIGPDGEGIGLGAHVQDIEAERQAAEALSHPASHETLPGIANRDGPDAQLAPPLAAVAAGEHLTVAVLDLAGRKDAKAGGRGKSGETG